MVSKDLIAASAKPLILSVLSRGESYGYEIIRKISSISSDTIQWKDGMLYPVLHKMEENGFISSKWMTSEAGRKRKYYRITAKGLKQLKLEKEQWLSVHDTLTELWGATVCTD